MRTDLDVAAPIVGPEPQVATGKARLRLGLTGWIFVGLVVGVAFGWLAPQAWSLSLKPLAKVFIRLIKMIVSPLVFSSLVVGLAGAGAKHVGRLLLKSLLWFWLATGVALLVGLGAANTLQPGRGAVAQAGQHYEGPREKPKGLLEQLVPESAVAAAAERAKLGDAWQQRYVEQALGPFDRLLIDFSESAMVRVLGKLNLGLAQTSLLTDVNLQRPLRLLRGIGSGKPAIFAYCFCEVR